MQTITSISNPIVNHVRKLNSSSRYREECGQFVAEGYNIVKDIPMGYISELYLTESAIARYDGVERLHDSYIVVNDKVMNAMSDTKTPSGVLAVCNTPHNVECGGGVSVLLDNLSDPGNVGTIIRTAVACGVENILLYGNVADVYSPKVVRSSMGGVFHINPRHVDTSEIRGELYVLDMCGENIFDMQSVANEYTLAVGSEAHGVSREIRERATKVLSLPMTGKMESLNAGVSMSIALYELINGGKY